jgi:hypothetical protein
VATGAVLGAVEVAPKLLGGCAGSRKGARGARGRAVLASGRLGRAPGAGRAVARRCWASRLGSRKQARGDAAWGEKRGGKERETQGGGVFGNRVAVARLGSRARD